MSVKQITVQMPNQPGALSNLSTMLGAAGVNIIAFFVSTSTPTGTGLLRCVTNNPDKAVNVCASKGMEPEVNEVVAAVTPHHPGGLNAVLKPIQEIGVNIEYLYPCLNTGEETVLILGMKEIDKVTEALKKNWIKLYDEELYQMAG
jgi:hypothetical protein